MVAIIKVTSVKSTQKSIKLRTHPLTNPSPVNLLLQICGENFLKKKSLLAKEIVFYGLPDFTK